LLGKLGDGDGLLDRVHFDPLLPSAKRYALGISNPQIGWDPLRGGRRSQL